MFFLSLLFGSIIIFIGGVTSYEDIRYGKIKNKWILSGLIGGILIFLLGISLGIIDNWAYIQKVIINTFIALVVGYLMWQYKLWAAGDAKLFALYAFLVPLNYYSNWYLEYFPSFVLLVNTFLLALCFLLAKAIYFLVTKRKNSKDFLKDTPRKIKEQGWSILRTSPILILIFLIIGTLKFPFNPLFLFVLLFFAIKPLAKLLKKNKVIGPLIIIFLTIILFSIWNNTISDLKEAIKTNLIRMAIFIIIFMGLNLITGFYLKEEKQKTTFFALWMFIGVIITFLIKNSLLHFVLKFIK